MKRSDHIFSEALVKEPFSANVQSTGGLIQHLKVTDELDPFGDFWRRKTACLETA